MIFYATRIDRNSINIIIYTLGVYSLMSVSEVIMHNHDGLTTSLAPYLPILLGTVWAAPSFAREIETGTLGWAWTKGVERRRWLLNRMAPMLGGAIFSGLILSALIAVTQRYWWPSMIHDRITPVLLAASPPVLVAFCLLAVGAGAFFAVATRKLITSIGLTFLSVAILSYAIPALAVQLAPTRRATLPVQFGHIVKEQLINGVTITSYVPNTGFWPLSGYVAFVVLLLTFVFLLETVRRVRIISL